MKALGVLICILYYSISPVCFAQNSADTFKIVPGKSYLITKNDGSRFAAKVISADTNEVVVNSVNAGILVLHRVDIKAIEDQPLGSGRQTLSYCDFGIGGGTHFLLDLSLNIINKHNNIFTTALLFNSRRDPNRPQDYQPGLLTGYPREKFAMLGFMFGKVLYFKNSIGRAVLKGGLGVGTINTPTDYTRTGGFFASNYDYKFNTAITGGLLLNPSIEFPVRRGFGWVLGVFANVNTNSPVLGVSGGILFGNVRHKR